MAQEYGNDEPAAAPTKHPLELHEAPPADYGTSGIHAPKDSLWHAVVRHFRALDRRPPTHVPFFNGNLFKPHFRESLIIGDEWLAGFIGDLSDDESPYLFNVIPVEILGSVYERFLGKVVRLRGRGINIEDKPEVRKAGGVYYTPRYIVDYIVEQTAGKLLDEISGRERAPRPKFSKSGQSVVELRRPTLKDFEKRPPPSACSIRVRFWLVPYPRLRTRVRTLAARLTADLPALVRQERPIWNGRQCSSAPWNQSGSVPAPEPSRRMGKETSPTLLG